MSLDYEEFLKDIIQSKLSTLHPGSNIVIGRGSLTPRVVFVGEAPGAKEDELKLPFVGPSGKLLDEMIQYLGLGEDQYYITNVVKTRPPNNRDPTKEEVEVSAPWLNKQLKLLNPEIIVAVGRFAMNHFFPKKKSILKESGKLENNIYIIPHPSYFLRRGGTGWKPYLQELKEYLLTNKQQQD